MFSQNLKYQFQVYFFLLATLTISCGTKRNNLFQDYNNLNNQSASSYPSDSSRLTSTNILEPGVLISIINIQNEALINGIGSPSTFQPSYLIRSDSTVLLPIIGKYKLAGLTIEEAENELNIAYKKNTLKDPIFKITILNNEVTLLGEFQRPGNFELTGSETTLISAVGKAGGFTSRANFTNLIIIRGGTQNPTMIKVNLNDFNSLKRPEMILKNGDIIYAQPKNIYTFGDKIGPYFSYVSLSLSILSILLLFQNR